MSAASRVALPFKARSWGRKRGLKLGGDYPGSRDETGTTISPVVELESERRRLTQFYALTSPDERHACSVDARLNVGPFDLIGEYLDERVRPRGPTASEFEPNGYYVQTSCFLIPKETTGQW